MSDRPAMPDDDRAQKAAWVERVLGIRIARSGPAEHHDDKRHDDRDKGVGIDNLTAASEAHSGVVAIEPGASKKQEMLQTKKQFLEELHETSGPDLSAEGVQRTADAAKRFVKKIESALSTLGTADEELKAGYGKLREDTEKFKPVPAEGAKAAGEAKKLLGRAEKLLERALAALGAMTEKSAGEMIGKAEAAEKAVTSTLMDLAKSYGFEPIGLEYRLKSLKSLKEKLSRDMIEEGKPLEQVAKNVSDVLRYTASFPSEKLADGAEGVLKDLESKGYKVVKLKNTWPDEKISYKGINAQLMTPDGQKMELQFHTPDSFWLKDEGTHDLYEQMRRPDISKQRKGQLDNIQAEMARHLDKPPGIDKIKNVVIQT